MPTSLRQRCVSALLECLIVLDHYKEDADSIDAASVDELQDDIESLLDILEQPSSEFRHERN